MEKVSRADEANALTKSVLKSILLMYLGSEWSSELTEPVYQYGPDVLMLTQEELHELPQLQMAA